MFDKIGPFVLLIIFNYSINKSINQNTSLHHGVQQSNVEIRMTRVSIFIVLIFLMCHIPRIILNVLEVVIDYNEEVCSIQNYFKVF